MILVTGATGFIGRHVLSRLLQSNKPEDIRILLMENEKDFLNEYPGLSYVIGDLGDEGTIGEAVRGVKPLFTWQVKILIEIRRASTRSMLRERGNYARQGKSKISSASFI